MAEDTDDKTNTADMAQSSASVTHNFNTGDDIAEVVEKILNTNELLENILVRLPIKKLLLAQRVCKHWKALITGSIRLQRALFMVPVPILGQVLKLKHGLELRSEKPEVSNYWSKTTLTFRHRRLH